MDSLPSVNPRAGDTNLDPNTENAPDTGYIAAISPLQITRSIYEYQHIGQTYNVMTTLYTNIPTTKYDKRALPGPASAIA